MNRRVLLMGRSGCGKTSLVMRVHEKTMRPELPGESGTQELLRKPSAPGAEHIQRLVYSPGSEHTLSIANKTQAAEYHPDFIDVPGEYLEVRSFYRALIMLTCEACAIILVQAADDEENLYPTGLARTFDKPVAGVVTKTDAAGADVARATEILRDAGAASVFLTSALKNEGFDGLIAHLDTLRNT